MSQNKNPQTGEKLIATNPIVHTNYFISEVLEAGVALTGTEVKSLRSQSPNLRDSFVEVKGSKAGGKAGFEAWLLNTHIPVYSHGNIWNHVTTRRRKLLLHSYELERLFGAVQRDGMNIIPIRMYFKNGKAKVEIGVGKGKKRHDKREDLKKRSAEREMDQALKNSRR